MLPWLTRAAARAPERTAIVTPAQRLSYAELEARALRAAGAMAESGTRPGDRIALALPDGAEFCVAVHACMLLGAVVVPVDPRLTGSERSARIEGAQTLLDELREGAPLEHTHRPQLDEVAALMHTSGTTSEPKPVPLTYGNWLASALGSADRKSVV